MLLFNVLNGLESKIILIFGKRNASLATKYRFKCKPLHPKWFLIFLLFAIGIFISLKNLYIVLLVPNKRRGPNKSGDWKIR